MAPVKKTSIKINNGDAPKAKPKATKKSKAPAKKAAKIVESTELVPELNQNIDMKQIMRKKLANTIAENRIDLTKEEDAPVAVKKDAPDSKLDLRDPDKIKAFDNVADRMREKISKAIGKSIPIIDGDKKQTSVEAPKEPTPAPVAPVEVKAPVAAVETAPAEEEEEELDEKDAALKEVLTPPQETPKSKTSPKLYRNIALFFIFCTLMLVAVIFYFYGTKMSIAITPKQEKVSDNILVEIDDASRGTASNTSAIIGVVDTITLEQSKEYLTTGSKVIGEDAVGKVTIYNNYIKNQPLVATTRLLAADGTLFRIRDTVNVPVGGSVEAEVYADKPGPDINEPPTKFTIPGLWAGIQDKIYAESKEVIKYQQQVEMILQQEDIENATKNLKETLAAEAKNQLKDRYKEFNQLLYTVDDSSITQSTESKVGDKLDKFTLKMKANVLVVAFDDSSIGKIAKEKLLSNLPVEKELVQFNDKQMVFKMDNYDSKEKVANVNVSFDGMTTLNKNANIIDKSKLDGLTAGQVSSYVAGLPGVDSYQVKYTPSWFKVVPKMPDRIMIEIK